MRTHLLSYLLGILTAVLILMMIHQHRENLPEPPNVDNIAAIIADVPNDTESDHRKQATLLAACQSLADLIQAGAITDFDEVIDAFRIETANLRTNEQWYSIYRRIETLLRQAEGVAGQEMVIRVVAERLRHM